MPLTCGQWNVYWQGCRSDVSHSSVARTMYIGLGKIVSVLGTRDSLLHFRKCNVRLSSKARAAIGKYCLRAAPVSSSS